MLKQLGFANPWVTLGGFFILVFSVLFINNSLQKSSLQISSRAQTCNIDADCPSGQMCSTGTCIAKTCNMDADCPVNQMCYAGTCVGSCPAGQTRCSGSCVDLMSSNENCGGCGSTCGTNSVCNSGSCITPACLKPLTPTISSAVRKSVSSTYDSVDLAWSAAAGATHYQIFQSTDGGISWTWIYEVGTTSFSIPNLNKTSTYLYKVRGLLLCSVNNTPVYGNFSAASQSVPPLTNCPTMNAPTISSPINNSTVPADFSTVLWYQPAGAVKYWVMVFDPVTGTIVYDSGKLQLAVQAPTVQNRYNFPAGSLNLTSGKQYSLEIYVENVCGNVHGNSVNITQAGAPPTNTPIPTPLTISLKVNQGQFNLEMNPQALQSDLPLSVPLSTAAGGVTVLTLQWTQSTLCNNCWVSQSTSVGSTIAIGSFNTKYTLVAPTGWTVNANNAFVINTYPTNTPTPGPTEKKACTNDAECGCGIDINNTVTTQCVFQNKKFLSTKFQCTVPDFCAGITGKCKPQCVNKLCEQTCPGVTPSSTPTLTATPTSTPTPTVTTTPIVCTAVSTTWVNKAIQPPQGQFTVEFDVKPKAANIDGVIGLSAAQASAFTQLATIIRFNTSGMIDARDGSVYRAVNSATYAPNIVYHIKMTVNPTTKKYSASVKFVSGNEIIIATDFAFRTEQANVTSLVNISAHAAVAAGLDLCSISVISATITPPNPAVCTMKKEGDSDCVANGAGKQITLADFEIWRTEYYNGCDSQNLTAAKCLTDDDNDGSLMDANFDYPGSSAGYTDEAVKIPDFEIWRQAYYKYGI